ncbi:hypothetical protein J8273_3205 [Carpediemonas membranifera]|uniref:Uncharacterized protein n=1 Tax=Carpediemonas membranifera TaxID=201153 RepID=A0A8J6AS59_9EUKA|nr:hypothetical protein J8273_3205 [Carpediemonas membranifera]|eukprot:KAG9393076.1 hypothetical protein J8273_3205 [Carpediemonas membranifera]
MRFVPTSSAPSHSFGQFGSGSSFSFGANAAKPQGAATPSFGAPAGGFGSTPAPANTGFGAQPASGGNTTGFGASTGTAGASTGFGGFGASAQKPAGTTGFGAPATGTSTTTTGFGAPASGSTGFGAAAGSTGFGAKPAGTTGFGSTATTGSTGFGSTTQPGAATTGFGAKPATTGFGASTGTTGTAGFGASTASTGFGSSTSTTGFGAAKPATGFGASTSTGFGSTGTSGFGSSGFGAKPAGTTGFGASTGFGSSSGFGQQAQQQANMFGLATSTPAPPVQQAVGSGLNISGTITVGQLDDNTQNALKSIDKKVKGCVEGVDAVGQETGAHIDALHDLIRKLQTQVAAATESAAEATKMTEDLGNTTDRQARTLAVAQQFQTRMESQQSSAAVDFTGYYQGEVDTLAGLISDLERMARHLENVLGAGSFEVEDGVSAIHEAVECQSQALVLVASQVARLHRRVQEAKQTHGRRLGFTGR